MDEYIKWLTLISNYPGYYHLVEGNVHTHTHAAEMMWKENLHKFKATLEKINGNKQDELCSNPTYHD